MYNSDAGAQIKTYPNNLGFVRNVTYDSFVLSSVAYPIAINVYWCGGSSNCPSATGTLEISNIQFDNFKGLVL
jgi:rhamnogalacturonan hydrolase